LWGYPFRGVRQHHSNFRTPEDGCPYNRQKEPAPNGTGSGIPRVNYLLENWGARRAAFRRRKVRLLCFRLRRKRRSLPCASSPNKAVALSGTRNRRREGNAPRAKKDTAQRAVSTYGCRLTIRMIMEARFSTMYIITRIIKSVCSSLRCLRG